MPRLILAALLAVLLYVSYAAYTVYEFASAVQKGDEATISAHVDFPSLRASIKEQLVFAFMSNGSTEKTSNPLATGLAAAFGPTIVGNLVETYVTPSGIAKLLENKHQPIRSQNRNVVQEFDITKFLRRLSVSSPTEFKLTDDDGSRITVRFEQWTWKISDIRLPATVLALPKPN